MTQSTPSASVGLIPKMDSSHVSKPTEGNCSKELSKCVNKSQRQDEDHCGRDLYLQELFIQLF